MAGMLISEVVIADGDVMDYDASVSSAALCSPLNMRGWHQFQSFCTHVTVVS